MRISYANITSAKVIFFLFLLFFSIPFYFTSGGTWWSFLLVIAVSSFVNSCYGIAWHRWLCHRSFTPHIIGKYLMLFSIAIQGSNRPLYLIAAHRAHHKYPDQEGDPHSPKNHTFLEMLLGRFKVDPILLYRQIKKSDLDNKELMFIQRHYYTLFLIFYLPFFLVDLKTGLLFLAWTFSYVNFVTSFVAYYTHYTTNNGLTYETRNLPRLISVFTMGEGLHKNHHDNPGSWTFASSSHPIDSGERFIRAFLIKR